MMYNVVKTRILSAKTHILFIQYTFAYMIHIFYSNITKTLKTSIFFVIKLHILYFILIKYYLLINVLENQKNIIVRDWMEKQPIKYLSPIEKAF